jgi:hypothetical protein
VLTVDNFTQNVAVAGMGAAFTGVCSPWDNLAIAGATHARMQHLVLPVGNRGAWRDESRVEFPSTMSATQLAMTAAPLPSSEARMQKTVKKTRINAGGYGAMGPHPEREPA